MHELLMQLARCVADVIKEARDPAQPPGNVLRSLLRVDVVLTEHYGQVSSCSTWCLGLQHAYKSVLSVYVWNSLLGPTQNLLARCAWT